MFNIPQMLQGLQNGGGFQAPKMTQASMPQGLPAQASPEMTRAWQNGGNRPTPRFYDGVGDNPMMGRPAQQPSMDLSKIFQGLFGGNTSVGQPPQQPMLGMGRGSMTPTMFRNIYRGQSMQRPMQKGGQQNMPKNSLIDLMR